MLAGLQQLSPIPCQITTGTGVSNFPNTKSIFFVNGIYFEMQEDKVLEFFNH